MLEAAGYRVDARDMATVALERGARTALELGVEVDRTQHRAERCDHGDHVELSRGYRIGAGRRAGILVSTALRNIAPFR